MTIRMPFSSRPTGRPMAAWLLAIAGLCLLLGARDTSAHYVGQSYLYLQVYEESLTGRFEIALRDLNPALGLAGTERRITRRNLDEHIPFLQDYYRDKVTISADGRPLTITFTEHGFIRALGGYVQLSFELSGFDEVPDQLTFDYAVLFDEDPDHRGFVLIETNWATGTFANEAGISLVLSPDARRDSLDLTTQGRWRGFVAVVGLGIEHIWEGIDHILFLFALLLPAVMKREEGRWKPIESFGPALVNVVKIVTAFTVAHSVTLSLAALGLVELPGRLVEVIIAGSIAIAAADILLPVFHRRVWVIVFAFGLFHGFGFAGALSEMGVFGEHLWLPLLAFNLGVEIGQVAIVAVVFPLLYLVRRLALYRKFAMPAGAVFLIAVSGVWVAERSLGIDVPMGELVEPVIEKVLP